MLFLDCGVVVRKATVQTGNLGPRFLPGYALGVAVETLHRVDVVKALGGLESSIHFLHVNTTVGKLRMAVSARGARVLAVLLVTSQATEAFMNTSRRPVVAGPNLGSGCGGVALIAESLPLIGADVDRTRAFKHLRQGQAGQRNVILLAAIEQGQRRAGDFLERAGIIFFSFWRA